MQQLNLQLYCKTRKTNFDELRSDRKTIPLTPIPTPVKLALWVQNGDDIVELRLDPDDKPSTFVLHELKVRAKDGTELYIWNGDPNSFDTLTDLEVSKINDEIVVQSFSRDPFLLIPLSKPEADGVIVELSVSRPLISLGTEDSSSEIVLIPNHPELAEAIRMLQRNFRLALDDLAEEQEGLQDALVVHHAHARNESRAISEQISGVLDFAKSLHSANHKLGGEIARIAATLEEQARKLVSSFQRRLTNLETSSNRRAAELETSLAELAGTLDASFERRLTNLETSSNRQAVELETSLAKLVGKLDASFERRLADLETSSGRRAAELETSLAELAVKLDASFERRLADLETSSGSRATMLEASLGDRAAKLQTSFDNGTKKLEASVNRRLEGLKASFQQLTSDVRAMEASFADAIAETAKQTRIIILTEVRDNWRSTRQQIKDVADMATKQNHDRESEILASIRAAFAGITQAVHRFVSSQDAMRQIRSELQVSEDVDAIASLQMLRRNLGSAQHQLRVVESSLGWRLTRPFRALSRAVKDLHKP